MAVGWVECVGHADRACYDLRVHQEKTGTAMTATKRLPEAIEVLVLQLKPDKKMLGPLLGDKQGLVFGTF